MVKYGKIWQNMVQSHEDISMSTFPKRWLQPKPNWIPFACQWMIYAAGAVGPWQNTCTCFRRTSICYLCDIKPHFQDKYGPLAFCGPVFRRKEQYTHQKKGVSFDVCVYPLFEVHELHEMWTIVNHGRALIRFPMKLIYSCNPKKICAEQTLAKISAEYSVCLCAVEWGLGSSRGLFCID